MATALIALPKLLCKNCLHGENQVVIKIDLKRGNQFQLAIQMV